MFVVTVAVDIYPGARQDGERVVVDLGLTTEDALFAFHNDSYKIANVIRQFTPYRFVIRNVQFSDADRLTMIALAEEKMRKEREARELCDAHKCEHVDCWN